VEDGRLVVNEPGRMRKFVEQVQQVTFSGSYAARRRQEVLYLTERAVFRLTEEGLLLEEIAPGADLQRDVLEMMDFTPLIPTPPRLMDALLFSDELLGLKECFRDG
jgi:propionate CoA-transferase